ncbi:MAG: PfkB family carbohydrate kinase, partial [Coriobacteriia bacterium]|nr:PfkB family carbohydrate kinase [Coriobacteriia bacterium]
SAAITSGYELDGPGGLPIIDFMEAHPHILFYYAPGPCILSVSSDKVARINKLGPIWHLNEMEALAYTGLDDPRKAGEKILEECNNAVVITLGAEGVLLFSKDECLQVPSTPVKPVDTIGAGDSHLGALIAARNQGATWQEALTLANRIAAAVCQQKGALLSDDVARQLMTWEQGGRG